MTNAETSTGSRRRRPDQSEGEPVTSADSSAVAPEGGSATPEAGPALSSAPALSVFFSDDLPMPEIRKQPTGRKSPFDLDAMPKGSHFLFGKAHESAVRRAASAANKRYAVADASGKTRPVQVKNKETGAEETVQRPVLVAERHFDVALLAPETVAALSDERLAKVFGEGFNRADLTAVYGCWRTV